MRFQTITILLISCLLLTSCVQTQQLEKLGVITSRGVDITEGDRIETSMIIFQFEAQNQEFAKVLNGNADTIKGSVVDAAKQSNYTLAPGKLELELYGKDAADKGISPYLDTLRRDANIPDTLLLAVSETKANDIISLQEKGVATNVGQFLHDLIEEESGGRTFPSVSLQQFTTTLNNEGIDPILPILGIREDIPEITGIALFKDDKMVGEVSIKEQEIFSIMDGIVSGRLMEASIPAEPFKEYIGEKDQDVEEIHTAYLIENGQGNIVLKDKKNLKYETVIDIELNLLESSASLKLDKPETIIVLEKEVEKRIKDRYNKIFEQMQELNTDVFGYGVKYRVNKQGGKLSDKEWDRIFPTIDVDFKVDVSIVRHGTVNK